MSTIIPQYQNLQDRTELSDFDAVIKALEPLRSVPRESLTYVKDKLFNYSDELKEAQEPLKVDDKEEVTEVYAELDDTKLTEPKEDKSEKLKEKATDEVVDSVKDSLPVYARVAVAAAKVVHDNADLFLMFGSVTILLVLGMLCSDDEESEEEFSGAGGDPLLGYSSGEELLSAVVGGGDPHIGSKFGDNRSWNTKGGKARSHHGTDLMVDYGTPACAVFDGVVTKVVDSGTPEGPVSTAGNYIVIKSHDGAWVAKYMHLSTANVSQGQQVTKGQVIGRTGYSGYYRGNVRTPYPRTKSFAHLHFELWENGVAIDPLKTTFSGGSLDVATGQYTPGKIAGIPVPESQYKTAESLYKYFVANGIPSKQALAIIGNLWQESKFNPKATNHLKSVGIFQAVPGGELGAYKKWAGSRDIWNIKTQADYIIHVYKSKRQSLIKGISGRFGARSGTFRTTGSGRGRAYPSGGFYSNSASIAELALIWGEGFENYGAMEEGRRVAAAQHFAQKITGNRGPASQSSPRTTVPASGGTPILVGDSWTTSGGLGRYFKQDYKGETIGVGGCPVKDFIRQVQVAAQRRPRFILVYGGANSFQASASKLNSQYKEMVRAARGIPIYVCTMIEMATWLNRTKSHKDMNSSIRTKINPAIRACGATRILEIERYRSAFTDSDYGKDGFHLKSYKKLWDYIKGALGGRMANVTYPTQVDIDDTKRLEIEKLNDVYYAEVPKSNEIPTKMDISTVGPPQEEHNDIFNYDPGQSIYIKQNLG